ncbi:hypothetical protein DICPUDRAFT_147635 [Dictyostelium purpureum]|uniref:Uncharacterized protein n=1 Tax=Dictyostelium purpureum TaxID=5786 RepID=F0Z903_DICPU|nr:uncharacterized protein DICPUDRAFT_147635 [Dictyostelium purpureum]EGC39552.1 hypothetical protein DICPUDRAFT_147635 [Dictyostelium purpureum]|eukprot:XP_003283887.1 hypothetical protein DICPUDRAFT_147635 [Dictyostelium purpureum]
MNMHCVSSGVVLSGTCKKPANQGQFCSNKIKKNVYSLHPPCKSHLICKNGGFGVFKCQ